MNAYMKKKLLAAYLLTLISYSIFAQSGRPDLPGIFSIEYGFNIAQNKPDNFNPGFFGSRTLNIYYQYELVIPILKNKFSVLPGIGFGLDRYKIKSDYTLAYEQDDLIMSKNGLDITKSKFNTNYLDIPIELRYTANPNDPSRSFKVSIGGRAGYLLGANTKIKYEDDDLGTIKDKSKRDWNVSSFRYGVFGKMGIGSVHVVGYYNLSTLFKEGKGPDQSSMNNFTIGLSWGAF
jgi:hypothetical protein